MASAGSRKRPRSRASTASIHSVTTQANAEQGFHADDSAMMATERWLEEDNESPNKKRAGSLSHLAPEELLMQAAEQLQAAGELAMDEPHAGGIPIAPAPMGDAHNGGNHSFMGDSSFFEADSQMLDTMDDADSNGVSGQPRQGGSRSSANNEKEMLQLFGANKNRTLQEVAEELHGNERGPNSERTRQVFAMLWYAHPLLRGCRYPVNSMHWLATPPY
jgi:regulatory factor X, other